MHQVSLSCMAVARKVVRGGADHPLKKRPARLRSSAAAMTSPSGFQPAVLVALAARAAAQALRAGAGSGRRSR